MPRPATNTSVWSSDCSRRHGTHDLVTQKPLIVSVLSLPWMETRNRLSLILGPPIHAGLQTWQALFGRGKGRWLGLSHDRPPKGIHLRTALPAAHTRQNHTNTCLVPTHHIPIARRPNPPAMHSSARQPVSPKGPDGLATNDLALPSMSQSHQQPQDQSPLAAAATAATAGAEFKGPSECDLRKTTPKQ